jgi:catechol 2,3-dioxygenase-like lactoylglutathione lyase family enzyme
LLASDSHHRNGKNTGNSLRRISMTVSIRYIVKNVDEAIPFYTEALGFHLDMHPAPGFASLSHGDLRLLLNAPGGGGGAGRAMDDGAMPQPGGWNRFQLEVANIEEFVAGLKERGVKLRSEIITGNGGKQVLAEDPSGNAVEIFQAFESPRG